MAWPPWKDGSPVFPRGKRSQWERGEARQPAGGHSPPSALQEEAADAGQPDIESQPRKVESRGQERPNK